MKTDKHGTKSSLRSEEFSGWCGCPELLSRESIYLEKTHQEARVQTKASGCKSAGLWAPVPIGVQTEAWALGCQMEVYLRSKTGSSKRRTNRKVCVSVYYATQKTHTHSHCSVSITSDITLAQIPLLQMYLNWIYLSPDLSLTQTLNLNN